MKKKNRFTIRYNVLEKFNGVERNPVIPDGVTKLGDNSFCYRNIYSAVLPDSVTDIGDLAFAFCKDLKSLKLPDGVKSIGRGAFDNCRMLASINLPEGLKSIGSYAFSLCGSLTSITVPESVTDMGKNIFHYCSELEKVYFRNRRIEDIPDDCINRSILEGFVSNFKNDSPPDEIINSYAEYFKENISGEFDFEYILTHNDILRFAIDYSVLTAEEAGLLLSLMPEYRNAEERALLIEYIGTHGGQTDLLSLERIPLEETLKEWEFRKNKDGTATLTKYIGKKTEIICPSEAGGRKVTGIGDECFAWAAVSVPISSVIISEGVTDIGENAFVFCKSLYQITFPESLERIGKEAFSGCSSLAEIFLPDNVKSIGEKAFFRCSSLLGISLGRNTEAAPDAFKGCVYANITRR